MGIKIATRTADFVSRRSWLPLVLLGLVCAASVGARSAAIGLPCRGSCRTPTDHLLIFDERYYVNAARVIAGIRPPAIPGTAYHHAPLGSDPNAEHPQLAKLIMAGSIELFGNGPWAWRLGSILFGTLAILGMFALVRCGGGSRWLALGAATLMATDNLMIVQGRIGTLEIYVVATMVWSLALYLRGRPLLAGLVAGVGACMKLFALDVVPVLLVYELLRWKAPLVKARVLSLTGAIVTLAGSFLGLLAVLDQIAHPYDNSAGRFVAANPFSHLSHMISYASSQVGVAGGNGIASYPWQWLVDYKPIAYLASDSGSGVHPSVHFTGVISPPTLLAGLIGTAAAIWVSALHPALRRWRGREEHSSGAAGGGCGRRTLDGSDHTLLRVSAAWFLGTFGPFLVASVAFNRTTYLYYMSIVMPGLYLAAAWLAARLLRYWWLLALWIACVAAAAIVFYPFTPLP